MPIDEAQLQTWSAQGATKKSRDTYATIKGVLESSQAPYATRNYDSFLQGSYANDTNVWADSDIDIVMRLNGTYYSDITNLSAQEQATYNAIPTANYGYPEFKDEVVKWLSANFTGVVPGKKAIYIPPSSNRREADVLPCAEFRRYHNLAAKNFNRGICFWSAGTRIENFPKQHSDNCTTKHKNTNEWFKPTVRIFKNLRNHMVRKGSLANGVAPSYFIEGLIYNVPNNLFGSSYRDTFIACYDWARKADRTKLVCANELHWLVRDGRHTSWPMRNCEAFFVAAKSTWDRW